MVMNYCPWCGNAISRPSPICPKCGKDLARFGGEAAQSTFPLSAAIEDLRKYSELRQRTDKIISYWWVAVPAATIAISLSTIVVLFAGIGAIIGSAASSPSPNISSFALSPMFLNIEYLDLASFAILIAYLFLVYNLIKRRNEHFERQGRVLYDATYVLKQTMISRTGQLSSEQANHFLQIDAVMDTMRREENPRSALLWAVLLIIPIVDVVAYFYTLYFLMHDFQQHETREDYVVAMLSYLGAGIGAQPIIGRSRKMGQRSFILYLVLLVVTLGIFGIYWVYVLIKDPNDHFEGDAAIESQLQNLVTSPSKASASQV
jgi:hypothetical protein